jgi:hypothetical protein
MARQIYDAARMPSRTWIEFKGATHYFEGQPDLLAEALDALAAWVETL